MNLVAIYSLRDDRQAVAVDLAKAMGITVFEARSRVNAPGTGPFVVTVLADAEEAKQAARRLEAEGFRAVVLRAGESRPAEESRAIKKFHLGEDFFEVRSVQQDILTLPYSDISLIIRGTGINATTTAESAKKTSLSLGRAVLSGGIAFTKTTKTVREVSNEEREGFFVLHASGSAPLLFREKALLYDSLGKEMRPSRTANFAYLVSRLRGLCHNAVYDERLLTRAAQAALLGPSLSPEEHISVAVALLARVLAEGPS
jgi:hypothetical protein